MLSLKILQVSPFYYPHIGGIEKHVWELSNKLVKAGHRVTVYTSNVPISEKHEIDKGVDIYRFKSYYSLLNNHFVPGYFFKLFGDNRFDIIHMHGALHFSSNITAFSQIFKRCPIVLTTHGATGDYQGWKGIAEALYYKTIGKWTLNSADRIITPALKEVDLLKSLGMNRDKIVVIPHGINLNQIFLTGDPEKFKRLYGSNNKKIILFVGGLIPRKGINYLIDAMRYVKSDSILLIVGGELQGHPDVKKVLKQQIKELGLKKRVLFLGRLSKEDLEKAYIAADLFVLPSLSEVFGLVILEAMSYGKCVIASNVLGPSTIIKNNENGILFEARNSMELAEKIDYLLCNEGLRKKIGAAARKEIEKKYNWDAAFNKILEVYMAVQKDG